MLDTNMASYIVRGANAGVMNRLDKVPPEQLCVSAITQGELLYGLARKPGAAPDGGESQPRKRSNRPVNRRHLARIENPGFDEI